MLPACSALLRSRSSRPSVYPYADLGLVPELFCGALLVVELAQVAGVAVLISAAERQWNDVIDHGGDLCPSLGYAVLAQAMRPS